MGRVSLWHGILAACLLSAFSVPLMLGMRWFGGGSSSAFIAVLGLGYVAYLLAISPSRRGRLVLGLASAAALFGAWVLSPAAMLTGLIAVGLIWLVRSVLFYEGILPVLWDGMLCTLSIACALGTAMSTNRLWLTVWVFFLLQALFVYIPQRVARSRDGQAGPPSQSGAFARAHRAAEEALQAMAQRA